MSSPTMNGWIGVDLDGTLAHYDDKAFDPLGIGAPIWPVVRKVQAALAHGVDVRIFTARVDGGKVALSMGCQAGAAYRDTDEVRRRIERWCMAVIGRVLPITNAKDYGMIELWDDRAKQVVHNTGIFLEDDINNARQVAALYFPGETLVGSTASATVEELCKELQLTRALLAERKEKTKGAEA